MKGLTAFLGCLMLTFCMSAFAQTADGNDTQMNNGNNMKHSDTMQGKTKSMVGCIGEKDGNYMLMNKKHPDGVGLMSTDDLKPHVGHKMKMTGMMQNGDSGMMAMKVTSMKMISDHCHMDKMMSK